MSADSSNQKLSARSHQQPRDPHPVSGRSRPDPYGDIEMYDTSHKDPHIITTEVAEEADYSRPTSKDNLVRPEQAVVSVDTRRTIDRVFVNAQDTAVDFSSMRPDVGSMKASAPS